MPQKPVILCKRLIQSTKCLYYRQVSVNRRPSFAEIDEGPTRCRGEFDAEKRNENGTEHSMNTFKNCMSEMDLLYNTNFAEMSSTHGQVKDISLISES